MITNTIQHTRVRERNQVAKKHYACTFETSNRGPKNWCIDRPSTRTDSKDQQLAATNDNKFHDSFESIYTASN